MRVTNWDAVATSAPLDRQASIVRDGSGDTWDHEVHPQIDHWKAPPLPLAKKPDALEDLTGKRWGRLVVVRFHGKREGKNAPLCWLVRCACGDYETRRYATALKATPEDACVICAKAERLRQRASLPPSKKQFRKQRAAFARIVGERP